MFASAGVDDFAWLRGHHAPTTLDELRAFARIRGRDAGAGHCLWADERAMQLLAAKAGVCLLIVDEQAIRDPNTKPDSQPNPDLGPNPTPALPSTSTPIPTPNPNPNPSPNPTPSQAPAVGARSGRRRGAAQAGAIDGRFVMVGEPRPRCVLLHRSRRQHFSPCFFRGQGVVEVAELPARTRALWPRLSEVHGLDTSAASPAGTCLPSASPPLAPPSAKRRKAKG